MVFLQVWRLIVGETDGWNKERWRQWRWRLVVWRNKVSDSRV